MRSQVDHIQNPEKPVLSPAQLMEIEADPSKMETLARLMGAVNLDNLFRALQNPDVALSHKIEFQKLLNKMGKLEPESKNPNGGGANVVINITRARDVEEAIVISNDQQALTT